LCRARYEGRVGTAHVVGTGCEQMRSEDRRICRIMAAP
jgi:hypothetical protein